MMIAGDRQTMLGMLAAARLQRRIYAETFRQECQRICAVLSLREATARRPLAAFLALEMPDASPEQCRAILARSIPAGEIAPEIIQ